MAKTALFFLAVVCFANSYDGEFVFDDTEAVVNNEDLLPSTPLGDLLYHDFWGKKLGNLSHKSYRPLTVLTFRWNYWAAGGLHPMGFHLVNIFLHGIVSVMMIPVFSLLLSNAGSSYGASKWPFLCSLLFAVHPVHTESVAGIVGRADLLSALLFILSFLFYVKGSTAYSSFRPEQFSQLWLCLSMVCCGLATFSKEQGITVIGVCSAYDILSICGVDLGALIGLTQRLSPSSSAQHLDLVLESDESLSKKVQHSKLSKWQLSLIKRHIFLVVSAVFLLVVRWKVMGSAPPSFQVHDNPHAFVNGSFYRVLNYNYLYAINVWILLGSQWLCFDWSMGCVPTITTLADPRLLAVVALWAAMAVLTWRCLCAESGALRRSLTLAVALIIIPYLPATNLLFTVGFVVAERVLYLPSAGFCLLVILGLRRLCQRDNFKTIAMTGFVMLVIIFVVRSFQRSNDWRQGIQLFKSGEKVCPLNAKVHYNIAKLTGDSGNVQEAAVRYRHAIELNPVYDQAMNNLANILRDQGQVEEAEMLLDKAVSISPDFAAAWMNRGITKAALKKYEEAEHSYREAIRRRRNYPDCYFNMGNMFIDMGRSQDALMAFHNATVLKPTHENAWNNAIIHMEKLNRLEQAVELALTALKVLPDNPSIMFSLANVYGKLEKYETSERWFLAALKRDPGNASIHLNLGVLYHRWGKYKEADEAYRRSLQLNPHNPVAIDNAKLLKTKMQYLHRKSN